MAGYPKTPWAQEIARTAWLKSDLTTILNTSIGRDWPCPAEALSAERAQDQTIAAARRGHLLIFDANHRQRYQLDRGALLGRAGVQRAVFRFDGQERPGSKNLAQLPCHGIRRRAATARALEVERAYLRLVELQERIKANESALNAAKENLDLANGRYQVGVGSIIEATDAQTLYAEAQTTYIQTLYDYKIAEAELTRAIGQ
jgi:hypothetical protein